VNRTLEAEWMDDPGLERRLHEQALAGLARLNRASRAAAALWKPLSDLARRHGRLRVMDLACGGGDVANDLARRARRNGLPLEIAGCDRSALAVARAGGEPAFFVRDVVRDFPEGYDVYLASLFLHHLNDEEAVALLRGMSSGRAFLVSDLRRTWLGEQLARVGARLFTRSPVVHADAPRSVRNAYEIDEVRGLLARAGIEGARIRKTWPQRFLVSWEA